MKNKRPLLLLLPLLFALVASAQPNPPGDPGGDPDVPITGIELLIGIGSLFGASRFLKSKNKSKES